MHKEIITFCIFAEICCDSNLNIKYVKDHSLFNGYELHSAFGHLKNFISWHRSELFDQNELSSINYCFDNKNQTIIWTIKDNTNINIDEYLNKVNAIIKKHRIHNEIAFNDNRICILTGRLILKENNNNNISC